jgi:catechol 2,3-dioxygenase-like lactoylglutathione lyase family enzyme
VDHGAAVKRLDHVDILAADVAANRAFAVEELGARLYEKFCSTQVTRLEHG